MAKYYPPNSADAKAIQDTGVTPATLVKEPDSQVDLDDNGEPIPEAAGVAKSGLKKVEDDAVVKKALEVLAKG